MVLAPHLGSATVETRTAMADLAVRNVLAVLAGEPLPAKANLFVRWARDADRLAGYVPLRNPFAR